MNDVVAMDLSEHQRKLLSMIKGTYHPSPDDEPYLLTVANSEYIDLVREIATWWRIFDLERYCVLTSRLLKQRGNFESSVDHFVKTHAISPFINELSEAFLQNLGDSDDPLLSEVASFELALTRIKRGDQSTYIIDWEHDPAIVLTSLAKGIAMDADEPLGHYRVTVSANLPGKFSIEPI